VIRHIHALSAREMNMSLGYQHPAETDWVLYQPSWFPNVGCEIKNLQGKYTYSRARNQLQWANFKLQDLYNHANEKPTAEFGDLYKPFNYTEVIFEVPDELTETKVITSFLCKRTTSRIPFQYESVGWKKQVLNHINIAIKSLNVTRYRGLKYRKDAQLSGHAFPCPVQKRCRFCVQVWRLIASAIRFSTNYKGYIYLQGLYFKAETINSNNTENIYSRYCKSRSKQLSEFAACHERLLIDTVSLKMFYFG